MNCDHLMDLHHRKLGEAWSIADACNRDVEEYCNAMVLYRKRLKQHADESEAHKHALETYRHGCAMAELSRGRKVGADAVDSMVRTVVPMARVNIGVVHVVRETRVMVPGTGRLVTFERRPVEGAGRVRRSRLACVADLIAAGIPRRNEYLFAYKIAYNARLDLEDPVGMATSMNEAMSAGALRAAGIVGHGDWRILPPQQCEEVLACAATLPCMSVVAVESFDPEAAIDSLVPYHRLQAEALERFGWALRKGAEQAIDRHRLPMPLNLPVVPALPVPHPGEPPIAPRALPGSLAYWSLPWESIYRLQGLEMQVPGRGEILLGYCFGRDEQSLTPVRVMRQQLHSHMHLTGATRAGKTTILAAIIVQLIRGSDDNGSWRDAPGGPPPILIVDPKGDLGLFHTARIEAQKRGQRFHAFTATASLRSDHIDIFGTIRQITTNPDEIAGILARALDLFHGPGYGKSHFGRDNANLIATTTEKLGQAVRECQDGGATGLSFESIIEKLKKMAGRGGSGANEAVNALEPLARMERLRPRAGIAAEDAIDLWRMVEERQVVYVYADQFGGIRNLDVMRLVLFLLNAVCQKRKEQARDRRVYAVVDEFKDVLSTNLGTVISTAAGNGLSLLMANQSVAQLRSGDIDVAAELSSNVNVRIFLTADSAEDIEDIQRLSGESPQWLANIGVTASTMSGTGSGTSTTWGRAESQSIGVTRGYSRMWSEFQSSSVSRSAGGSSSGSSEGSSTGSGVSIARKHESGSSDSVGGGREKSLQASESEASTMAFTEAPRPTININEILATASRQLACFLWVRHDINGTDCLGGRLIAMQAIRCLERDEYQARDRTPWPRCETEPQKQLANTPQQAGAAGGPPKVPGQPANAVAAGIPDDREAQLARLKFLFESYYQAPVTKKDKKQ